MKVRLSLMAVGRLLVRVVGRLLATVFLVAILALLPEILIMLTPSSELIVVLMTVPVVAPFSGVVCECFLC